MSIVQTHPLIATQWHPSKNGTLLASKVTAGSGRKVWWKDNLGHEWEQRVSARTQQGQGCPYCSGRLPIRGETDLATLRPDIANQWHPTKNQKSPSDYPVNSHAKVWWVCEFGHEWETRIHKRTHAGHGCLVCSRQHNHPVHKGAYSNTDSLNLTHPELLSEWHPTKNTGVNPEDCTHGTDKKVWWSCSYGHEWEAYIYKRTAGQGCPYCAASKMKSNAELEIVEYLKTHHPDLIIETSVRNVITSSELDIYLPEYKIAIEYNGLYWHSEATGKGKWYHHTKWLACKEKGIQLIQIWEDDWNSTPEKIKRMLDHKLGSSSTGKIHARKSQIVSLTNLEAHEFMEEHHIQNGVDASIRFGLKYQNELVAVMLLKHEAGSHGKTLNLLRYATSKHVVGGFTKLLSHVERANPNVEKVITFSDHMVSNGTLYSSNGFEVQHEVDPDYMYFRNRKREHKFGYRLKRFRDDPSLKYREGYTERELAQLNGLNRIWDAGKTKWVKTVKR